MDKLELSVNIRVSESLAEFFTLEGNENNVWLFSHPEGSEKKRIVLLNREATFELNELTQKYIDIFKKFDNLKE